MHEPSSNSSKPAAREYVVETLDRGGVATVIAFGAELCGSVDEAQHREWIVTDGTGSFAMGCAAMLRTRRYHGLLVVATAPPVGRELALAALEPVLVDGDVRTRLGCFEWANGAIDPTGNSAITSFTVHDGVPSWRYQIGDVALDMTLAMTRGRPAVGVLFTLVASPRPVTLELGALCTWRDVNYERLAGPDPEVEPVAGGFVFEGHYRVRGPDFHPGGAWYRGAYLREEAARGLGAVEDLWHAGRFVAPLAVGEVAEIAAWAGDLETEPPPAREIVEQARRRARVIAAGGGSDAVERQLRVAVDPFIVTAGGVPHAVAGYPWFGWWSRDTMLSYEGLFLATGRHDEGRRLLVAASQEVSEGMLANTGDIAGAEQYNSVDGTLWFVHAVGRHVEVMNDDDLAASLLPVLQSILTHYDAGARFGIGVDPNDGLLRAGHAGKALTWMDARVDGVPMTWRAGKPVEVNALWVNACAVVAKLAVRTGGDPSLAQRLGAAAVAGFRRFARSGGAGLLDVVDDADGHGAQLRPNQLFAVSLPSGPLAAHRDVARVLLDACAPLVTPLGLRTLDPADRDYRPLHRGDQRARDRAYHNGTVWPFLIGAYVDVALVAGRAPAPLLAGLEAHLAEFGLSSISETADGAAPHNGSGCPFQAWSVAELLRAWKRLSSL